MTGPNPTTAERNAEIVAMWRGDDTLTLQAIGDVYGMTRERVRQILAREGVTPTEIYGRTKGGKFAARVAAIPADEQADIEQRAGSWRQLALLLGARDTAPYRQVLVAAGWEPRGPKSPYTEEPFPDRGNRSTVDGFELLASNFRYWLEETGEPAHLARFTEWAQRTGLDKRSVQSHYNTIKSAGMTVAEFAAHCGATRFASRLVSVRRSDAYTDADLAVTAAKFVAHCRATNQRPTCARYDVWRKTVTPPAPSNATMRKSVSPQGWGGVVAVGVSTLNNTPPSVNDATVSGRSGNSPMEGTTNYAH